jgi:hypothetical protein
MHLAIVDADRKAVALFASDLTGLATFACGAVDIKPETFHVLSFPTPLP